LGADYSDYLGNKPTEAKTLIFSTGKNIDSGSIKGIIFDKNPSGIDVYAYRLSNINPDTLNPATTKAEYRTQTGTSGSFEFMALKDGKYRIVAVRDALRDAFYNEGTDDFGAYTNDISIRQDSVPSIVLKLGNKIDKIKPKLYEVESFKNRIIRAFLDEKPDSLSVSKKAFVLTDSLGRDTIDIISACMSFTEQNCIELLTGKTLDLNKTWKLYALPVGDYVLRDSAGNKIDDTSNYRYFKALPDIDYEKPAISRMPFKDSSQSVSRSNEMSFILTSPIDYTYLTDKISFIRLTDSLKIEFDLIMFFDNIITIKPKKILENDQWYRISLRFSNITDMAGTKSVDTVYNLSFKTEDTRNWGRISGMLTDSSKCGGSLFIILESVDSRFRKVLNTGLGGKWLFEDVPPGDYRIEVFCDRDNNGVYTYGNAFPFIFADPFKKLKESLTLKPRWNIDDVKIIF
jgi:hypothetical protein